MIDHSAARAKLAEIVDVTATLPDLTVPVYQSAIDVVAAPPLIAIGLPRWTPNIRTCMDRSQIPIAVVVPLAGDAPSQLQDRLEQIWQQVVVQLTAAFDADQLLGGLCGYCEIDRSEPGRFRIQNQEYPAQLIFTNLDG